MDITEYRLDHHDKQFDPQNARLERIEATVGDVKLSIARLEAGLAGVDATLDRQGSSIAGLRATVILTGIASVALVVAVLTYGQIWFDIGATTQEIVRATVLEMQRAAVPAKP